MTTAFDVVFPNKARQVLDGGKNSKFERSIIAKNESPDCVNVVFTNGAVATRGGSTKLNTASVGSFVGDGIYTRHDITGPETMIIFAGGLGYALTGASTFTTIPSAQSVFTAGVRIAAAEYENHIFFGNGGVNPYKYNGSTFTRHGVPQATGTVTLSSNATGLLTGGYRYKVTFVNSQVVEGDVGTSTVTFTAASATIRLTGIPTAPQSHGVSARRIYRTDAGGLSYKRVTTINDNTTTTYDDNLADSALGVVAPTDNGEPPKYNAIVAHQGRLFMNDTDNPNLVWYTEIFEPYTVKSTNFQPAGDASFDLVKGVAVYDNGIVIQGVVANYLWSMPSVDPTTWRLIRVKSPYGSKSPFGSFLYNNKLMVPAVQNSKFAGFAAIQGSSIDPEATYLESTNAGSDLKSERIEPDMFEVQEAYVGNISAIVFKNKAYIALTYGSGATTNNRVYVYDFSISNLSKKQEASWAPMTGVNAAQFAVYDGKLYFIDSTATGFVRQLETLNYVDDSAAINSYFWTKEFSGLDGHENMEKDFRYLKLLVDKAGAYYMSVAARTDSDSGGGTTYQVDLDPGATTWGGSTWGGGTWGAGADQAEIRIPLGLRGKRIQFMFSNQNAANQRFKVHGLNYNYNIKGKR